jgi:hypothetical protein
MLIGLKTPINCLVRNKYILKKEGYTEALIIAITCEQSRQPTFTVLLNTGAKYDPLPINALCWKQSEEMELKNCSWWDSLSNDFNIETIPTIKGMPCEVLSRNKIRYTGHYLLSIKFTGSWADLPSEHKVIDLIKLNNGNFFFTVNNKTRFLDESFVVNQLEPYLRNNQIYTTEN